MEILTNCDVVASIGSQDYHFDDVDIVAIDDPRTNQLTRGMNGKNKVGFVVEQNSDQPTVITTTLKNLDDNTSNVLKDAYKNKTRFDFNVINSTSGKKKYAKNCIVAENPIQRTIGVDTDSYNMDLVLQTYDYTD